MLEYPRCKGNHDICFYLKWLVILKVKFKENIVIPSLTWDSVKKTWCHDDSSVGIHLLLWQRKKNKADHPVKTYSFRCKKVFMLFRKYTISWSDLNVFSPQKHFMGGGRGSLLEKPAAVLFNKTPSFPILCFQSS